MDLLQLNSTSTFLHKRNSQINASLTIVVPESLPVCVVTGISIFATKVN